MYPLSFRNNKLSGQTRRDRFSALYHSGAARQVINAQRQILRPLSFIFRKLGDKRAETNSSPFVIQKQQVERWAETNYGHSAQLFAIQRRTCPTKCRDKLWSFCVLYQPRGANSTVSGWCVGTDHFQFFAGSAGREVHWTSGVSLERN